MQESRIRAAAVWSLPRTRRRRCWYTATGTAPLGPPTRRPSRSVPVSSLVLAGVLAACSVEGAWGDGSPPVVSLDGGQSADRAPKMSDERHETVRFVGLEAAPVREPAVFRSLNRLEPKDGGVAHGFRALSRPGTNSFTVVFANEPRFDERYAISCSSVCRREIRDIRSSVCRNRISVRRSVRRCQQPMRMRTRSNSRWTETMLRTSISTSAPVSYGRRRGWNTKGRASST